MRKIKLNLPCRKKLEKECDGLWAELIKVLAGYHCKVCFSTKRLNSHHIFSRKHKGTRWLEENGICLCWAHHKHLAHGEPEKFRDFLIEEMGETAYKMLKFKASTPTSFSVSDLIVMKSFLEKRLQQLGAKNGRD